MRRQVPTPSNLGSYVGRADDLTRANALVARGTRLLTITGTGGVGKTRFVLELTVRGQALPRATFFCDLSSARTAQQICLATARVLGVAFDSTATFEQLRDSIGRALERRGRALVVFDNFEQVAAHSSSTLSAWLSVAPSAQFLVTSRVRLGIRGEQTLDLLPLPLPGQKDVEDADAVRLFLDRAEAVAPERYGRAPEERATVAAIVRRLEGLPLAIELAAPRTRLWSPTQLLERLARRFDVLARGDRDLPARQQTLRRTIDWSWRLLEPSERIALAACSVFRGGFTLEAAEAVLEGIVSDVSLALEGLRNNSLIQIAPTSLPSEPRIVLLESVREYAALRLAKSARRVRERHADYFLRWARARTRSRGDLLSRLNAEEANLLAVVEYGNVDRQNPEGVAIVLAALVALEPLYASRGPMADYATSLDHALARVGRVRRGGPGLDPHVVVRARIARGSARQRLGQWRGARTDFQDAVAAARASRDREAEALARVGLGAALHQGGDLREGMAHFERALGLAQTLAAPWLEARVLTTLAFYRKTLGYSLETLETLARACQLFDESGDIHEHAVAQFHMAAVSLEYGDLDPARALCEAAIPVFARLGDRTSEALAMSILGCVAIEQNALDQAAEFFERGLELASFAGAWRPEGVLIGYLGVLRHLQGRRREAHVLYSRAIASFRAGGATQNVGLFQAYRGSLLSLEGRLEEAEACFADATQIVERPDDLTRYRAVVVLKGHVALARAERAQRSGALEELTRCQREAREPIARARSSESGPPWTLSTNDVRLAILLLEQAIEAQVAPRAALVVARDGSWFRPPFGDRVTLPRPSAQGKILLALCEKRHEQPGLAIGRAALSARGWPGEKLLPRAGANRLYVALNQLKKLGLDTMIERDSRGWRLSHAVPLLWAEPEPEI